MAGPSASFEEQPEPIDGRYLPGEILDGKYRLIRQLGQGGVGRVWVAHNLVLDVQVAIKIIYTEPEGSGTQGARLLQEARSAARLGHPAIVRVYDFGETRHGDPFVAMELLDGETLADLLEREGRMPAIRAIQTLLPIADALGVAHAKGIVHRDVKPENIFIARDEAGRVQPKLLDFGIARVESNHKLTIEGTVLGTPDYMSPEQARGDSGIDQRSDIWSYCVVLYELMTGEVPFSAENYNALLNEIIESEPRPLADLAAGDADLWRILQHGMQKEPKRRWESIRMLGEALALWLYERGIREDVCASSLKTSWLESGLSDVTIDVGSTPPAEQITRETLLDPEEVAPTLAGEVEAPGAALDLSEPPPKRRWPMVLSLLLLGLLAAAGYFLAPWKTEPLPTEVAAPAPSPPPDPAPAPVEPAAAAEREEPKPSVTASAVGSREPTPPSAGKAPLKKRPTKKKSGEYDFGF